MRTRTRTNTFPDGTEANAAFDVSVKGEDLDWTTQAIGQQHTSPLRAGCEARRREIVVIFGCGGGGGARSCSKTGKVERKLYACTADRED